MKVSKRLPSVQRQVDALEAAGYEVQLAHSTQQEAVVNGHTHIKGVSTIDIVDPFTGTSLGWGKSFCSLDDNFDRSTGTRIAFHRAVNDFYRTVGYEKAGEVFA